METLDYIGPRFARLRNEENCKNPTSGTYSLPGSEGGLGATLREDDGLISSIQLAIARWPVACE